MRSDPKKQLVRSLLILGAVALLSSLTGITSIRSGHPGLIFSKYPNLLGRGAAGIFGVVTVLIALWVRRRDILAWKAVAFLLPMAWVFFVIGSTLSVASAYSNPSTRDTLLFGGMVTVLSCPVMIYWERRWLKQKNQFQGNWLSRDPIGENGGLNLYSYVRNNPIGAIDPLGLRDVDVYIWNAKGTSVGHVMVTEHDSTQVILSQFPANGLPDGRNITLPFQDTMDAEGRAPNDRFVINVPNDKAFDDAAAWERAKKDWNWDPNKKQTQCSTAAWNSLADGGVSLGGHVDGTLLPGTMADTLEGLAPFSHGKIRLLP
jgi:hypothetical protein